MAMAERRPTQYLTKCYNNTLKERWCRVPAVDQGAARTVLQRLYCCVFLEP